ncbi:hypothetical protein [Algoriphagus sp.]|uniref:hypothetical protein n=1 Tax=Algoriphagus sp. TaxID=1872435 RepID=UPI003F726625
MKIILSLGLFCTAMLITSICYSQNIDEKFSGKWKVSKDINHLSMDAKYLNYDKDNSLSSGQFKRLQASMDSREYYFSISGLFTVGWEYANSNYVEEGKWSVDDNGKLHLVTNDTHLIYSFSFLENNQILMIPVGQEMGQVRQFILIKE